MPGNLSLGGVPMAQVERRFARIFSRDNRWLVKHRLPNVLAVPGVLKHLGIGDHDILLVTFGDAADDALSCHPSATAKSTERANYQPKALTYAWAHQRSVLRYRLLPDERFF